MNKTVLIVVSGLIVILVAYVLMSGEDEMQQANTQETSVQNSVQNKEPKGSMGESEENVINMLAGNIFFDVSTINAKVGEKVVLDIRSEGQHTFTIDELGVNEFLPNGKTTRVEFTPTESGTYRYYCAIPGHAEAGQVGTLIVQ